VGHEVFTSLTIELTFCNAYLIKSMWEVQVKGEGVNSKRGSGGERAGKGTGGVLFTSHAKWEIDRDRDVKRSK